MIMRAMITSCVVRLFSVPDFQFPYIIPGLGYQFRMLAPAGNRIKFFCLCAALNCLANFQDSYPNSYPNTAHESFEKFINQSYIDRGNEQGLTQIQFTWIWSAILNVWAIGYFIGSFSTPFFVERFGRKVTMVMANAGSLVGTSLAVISVTCGVPELLFVARLCSAIMSGISYSALILFLQETTPTEIRGMTSFMSETAYLSISVLGMGLGMQNVLGRKLPFLIGIHAIAAITAVVVMVCVKETPKYLLINRNDADAAIKSLEYYNGSTSRNAKVIESIKKEAEEGHESPFLSSIPMILKTRHLRQAFLVGFCSMQIMLTIIPINYVSTIVLKAHFSSQMAQIFSFVFISCNFVASIFGMFAVDRFGRRPMLLVFGALNVFFLCSYCVFDRLATHANEQFKYGCVISLVGYGITYGGALGPIAFFITSELVPQQFRSAVQAMVYSLNTVFNFTFSFSTLPLYRLIDVWSFIPLFIVPSMLALTYLFFNLPETKGREIHEIVRELAGGHYADKVAPNNKLDISKDEQSDQL